MFYHLRLPTDNIIALCYMFILLDVNTKRTQSNYRFIEKWCALSKVSYNKIIIDAKISIIISFMERL